MPLTGLYTCDLICWGAASPALFSDYLRWLGGRRGLEVVGYRHRAKGAWSGTRAVAELADGREASGPDVDLWSRLWYGRLCRPSCNACGFHSTDRPGDVTIGDYWGLDAAHPGLAFGDGTSCLVASDARGAELVAAASGRLQLVPSDMGRCANGAQPMLLRPPATEPDRDRFWDAYLDGGLEAASRAVGALPEAGLLRTAKGAIKRALRPALSLLRGEAKEPDRFEEGWKEAEMSEREKKEIAQDWPRVYAAKNASDDVRARSASGGMFHALAETVIGQGGVVYGCAFDERLRAVHVRCETMAEAERCMGSKYSQSHMGDAIKGVRDDLEAGRTVLFTGTPCQVAAVRRCCESVGGGC